MKENSFNLKEIILSKSNDNIIFLKANQENSKATKNEKSFHTQNDNLINFISDLNKFSFSSAFDHKGAKSFLKSKEKALDEIILDEDIQSYNDNDKKNIKINEDDAENKIKAKRKDTHTGISPLSIRNKYLSQNNEEKKEISPKTKARKNQSRKELNNFKIWKNKNDEKVMNELGLKMPKISSKFCSRIELKMFNDKNLNKIKPIKVPRPKYTHKNLPIPQLNQNNRNSSIKSNSSSLLKLITEISKA